MTKYPEIDELIHADVDGVASEADRARLRDLLAANDEAREEHRRLLALRDALAELPDEAPPAHFVSRVMRRIREEGVRGGGVLHRLFGSWPAGRVAIPYAYAAAAGAAVGILGFHVLTGGGSLGPDAIEQDAAATIGAAPLGVETGRIELTAGNLSGSATLRSLDGSLAVDVDMPAAGTVDVSVGYDPAVLKLVGISNRTGGVERFASTSGTVGWSQSRPQRVTVFFVPRSNASSEVHIRFSAEGGVDGGGTMSLPGRS